MEEKENICGLCRSKIEADGHCPRCGFIKKTEDAVKWIVAREKFLEIIKCYIPRCPNCGALILSEDECDIFDEMGISGEGGLQLPLAIRSEKKAYRCVYCEDNP